MPRVPAEMMQQGRAAIAEFDADEELYRRIPLRYWEDDEIHLDAIELPDMSVNRSSLGPPWWVRLGCKDATTWAVVAFSVKNVPSNLTKSTGETCTFPVVHKPSRRNYPHTEVQCHEEGGHIVSKEQLEPGLHLEWRELLARRIRIALHPNEIPAEQREFLDTLKTG